jgi:hypothetical protein
VFNYFTDAIANTAYTAGTSNTYAAASFAVSGQLWAVIKDSNGNKLALSVTPNCTTTTTTTTTTTAAPCECWTIVNEGGGTGNYSYDRCSDGTTLNRNIGSGVTQTVCARAGTTPSANSGTLTIYSCGTPCSVNSDCAPC